MKTYQLWLWSRVMRKWMVSPKPPHTFTTLEEANTEMAIRTFEYDGYIRYKIVESEEEEEEEEE